MTRLARCLARFDARIRRLLAVFVGAAVPSIALTLFVWLAEWMQGSEAWLGVYLYLAWPTLLFLGGILAGSLLPAPGARPGWEALACAPGIWVVAYSTIVGLPDGGSMRSAAIGHVLSWAGTFAGLMVWNLASESPLE